MRIAISLVLVAVFLAMNAFFVIAEFALVRVRKSQLDLAVERNAPGATNARLIAEDINSYLSACQLGITLASLALGWLGEPAFAQLLRPAFAFFGLPESAVSVIAVALGFFIMTMLHVVIGELIPKAFAIFSTEKYALSTATALLWFYKLTYPIMVLFNGITNAVVKLFGHDPKNDREVYTEEEIQLLIDESTESGLIDPEQNEYVDNIFDMGDKDVESIMTPRVDIICLDASESLEQNLATIGEFKFTRFPVCDENKDNIVGFVHVKDLYLAAVENARVQALESLDDGFGEDDSEAAGLDELDGLGGGFDHQVSADVRARTTVKRADEQASRLGLSDGLRIRPIEAVPESLPVTKLIELFRDKHTKIAVVVDEHGGTAGIVTMSDVLDEIVGPSDDEYRHGGLHKVRKLCEGTYDIEGDTPLDELEDVLGFLPDGADEYETAAGLMLSLFGRIPLVGNAVEVRNAQGSMQARFTIISRDRLRIDRIRLELSELDPKG